MIGCVWAGLLSCETLEYEARQCDELMLDGVSLPRKYQNYEFVSKLMLGGSLHCSPLPVAGYANCGRVDSGAIGPPALRIGTRPQEQAFAVCGVIANGADHVRCPNPPLRSLSLIDRFLVYVMAEVLVLLYSPNTYALQHSKH